MKKIVIILCVLCALCVKGITPFYFSARNSDGSPFTNPVTMQFWPPSQGWVSNGTNMIWGGTILTNTPNALGFFSNSVFSGTYKVAQPALGSSAFFYAVVPDTTNYQSLNLYATNVAVSGGVQTSAGIIAGMLGYTPVANTYSAVSGALGFVPATNGGAITVAQLPYTPATNGYAGISAGLGFNPATNSQSGITSALQYTPATNGLTGIAAALGYTPPTNTPAGIIYALQYTPPTNTPTGLNYAYGFQPATNPAVLLNTNLAVLVPGPSGTTQTNYVNVTNSAVQGISHP